MRIVNKGADYYLILGVTESATLHDLHKAYRREALRYHPLINKDKCEDTFEQFKWISEAYEVLKNPILRARYDQYGEVGLKNGIPGDVRKPVKFIYHDDPYKTFQEYFGDWNPFKEIDNKIAFEISQNFSFSGCCSHVKKADPAIVPLQLTLEEIYNGCLKKVSVDYKAFDKDCQTTNIKKKSFTLVVQPGFKEKGRLIFSGEGNQGANVLPGDIIFEVTALEHPFFRREGLDLYHTEKIHVGQALLGCVVDIQTLDNRLLHVPISNVIRQVI
ncbi:unnamed protein product [Rodentolepis nana]|uniref:J domain-containing protein n=1 Tax=Rodentolepis nana TaxID=102285 RepID=A0A0R3T9Z0_RODNA|nr:unnamed protein product [Rodentolepis nana]